MADIPGIPGGGANIKKQGGDAMGGSIAYSGALGGAYQDGSHSGYGSAEAGAILGAESHGHAGDATVTGGAGGTDQTTIGDITINT
ncbi:MAG: hypothetical protein ABII06_20140 [Pseudomonadota bacterium]